MKLRSLKKDEAINQWKAHASSLNELNKRNDGKQTFHVRTSFALAAMGIGLMALTPTLTLPIALISGVLTAGGLGSALAFYTHHAMKGTEIKHAVQYCRTKELDLIENTRAKKGNVVEDFESISAIIKQNAKDEGVNYTVLVTKETFRDHDIKMMYVLTMSTIAASAVGMYMMLSPTNDQAFTPTGRKEEIEQNDAAVISNEGQSTQPMTPMLAR